MWKKVFIIAEGDCLQEIYKVRNFLLEQSMMLAGK